MRWAIVVCCLSGWLGWATGARAADAAAPDSDGEAFVTSPAVRRSGFSFGITGGLAMGTARGYLNDVSKIGSPEFETHTGFGFSTGGALWIGGALTDWLNVGFGTFGGGVSRNGLKAAGGAFHARIESFPLFYRGGAWKDFGVLLTAGLGGYEVKRGSELLAEGQSTSAVGLGVFYEPWRFWQFSTGPQIEYGYQFSRSLTAHTLVVGWRTVFYGGP